MLSAALLVLAMAPGVTDAIFRDTFDAQACPAGRQTRANISWHGSTLTNVDVTQWANVWGRSDAFDPPVPWPGLSDSMPTILNFGKDTYMALEFRVPPGSPPNLYGWITHTEYNYGADLTASISTGCGDFEPPSSPLCLIHSVSGQLLVPWALPPPQTFCPLVQNGDYFLNLVITDPRRPSTTCAPAEPSCVVGTANNYHTP